MTDLLSKLQSASDDMCKHQRARRVKGGAGILECCHCGMMFADLHSLRMERIAIIKAQEARKAA